MCDVDSSGSWGEGECWLVALSANQREETRREREGAGQGAKERTDVREEGKEVENGGCKTVSTPFARSTLSASLTA